MADSEKLTALKKAYADIILNSAKEAAARKAQRYQRELFAAKDESLRMLLRLKQMLDSKVTEAEMTSLSQQKRIEELEAQLGEAEDIVKDLRAEVRELQDELEKVISRQKHESNSDGQNATLSNPTEDNKLGNKCYAENGACKDNCFACSPDFASIVIRRKEPELYRNGCTQRIRAFERNLVGGKNQVLIGDEQDKKNDSFCDVEKTPELVKDIEADNRIRKRKSTGNQSHSARGAGIKNHTFVKKEIKHNFSGKRSRLVVKNGGVIPRRIRSIRAAKYGREKENKGFPSFPFQEDFRTDNTVSHKDPEPVLDPKSLSGPEEVIKIQAEFGGICSSENALSSDKLPVDELELTGQDAVKFPGGSEASPVEPVKNKFLKYTFQRKRKREFLSSPDSDRSLENNTLARKMEGEQNDSLELEKSGLVTESSRDSRRLAQVARQLISLSEKKSW